MELISDMLLLAGALGAGLYCHVLARRLRQFTDLETGVGAAVNMLAIQVDDLKKSVDAAQKAADGSVTTLTNVSARAEKAARQLELLVASLHDIPSDVTPPKSENPFFVRTHRTGEVQQ